MLVTRLLNACHHFPGFVYERARLCDDAKTIEIEVRCGRAPRRAARVAASARPGYDQLAERRFEFIPIWGFAVMLLYAMRRVECRRCGVKVEEVPWGEGKHTLDKAYMLFLAHWARKLSWKETARSVSYLLGEGLPRGRVRRAVGAGSTAVRRPDRAIGVDEIQYAKGHQYLTLVYQIEARLLTRLLWVGKERTVESFQQFFTMIGEELAAKIEFVCSDMWKPYLRVIREQCSQALHILDRFHIVAKMNKALDEVRAGEARRMAQRGLRAAAEEIPLVPAQARREPHRPAALPAARSAALQPADACALICSRKTSSSSGNTTRPPGPASSWTSGAAKPCAPASSR